MSESKKFVDESASTKYTVIVGIVGIVFLLGQWFAPMLGMFTAMFGLSNSFTFPELDRAVFHKGEFWYPVRTTNFEQKQEFQLIRLEENKNPRVVLDSKKFQDGKLLSTSEALWVFRENSVNKFQGGGWTTFNGIDHPNTFSCLFDYQGKPAVVRENPPNHQLYVFSNKRWQKVAEVRFDNLPEKIKPVCSLQVLPLDETLHFFHESNGTIYHHTQALSNADNPGSEWTALIEGKTDWKAIGVDDKPAIFYTTGEEPFEKGIKGLRKENGNWETILNIENETSEMNDFAIAYDSNTSGFHLLSGQFFPGQIQYSKYREGETVLTRTVGTSFMSTMMTIMMVMFVGAGIIVPLLLAAILSYLMSKYRVPDYTLEDQSIPHASLLRRALARLADTVLIFSPAIIPAFFIYSAVPLPSEPKHFFFFWVVWFGGFFWAFIFMFVFGFTEGRWGITPGKWLVGIEVRGEDLDYCGFGRGLVRNLLMLVDGFFYFIVGLMVVALTEKWQRVGDLVAQTVVIRSQS